MPQSATEAPMNPAPASGRVDAGGQKSLDEALRESDRRKDEFLATLAHELRNPLAPLSLAAQMLASLVKDDKAAGMVAVVQRQVDYMVRLIDDLMDISRISRGKIELRESDTDLNALLDNAVEIARPHLQAANHNLELSLPEGPLRLHVDPVRIAQIIANLLNNAARYTPDGGRIGLSARRENGEVKISVRDNGAGIAEDALPHIFDLFAQGRQRATTRSDSGGLGVGLALARGLAELHGGHLTARSDGAGRGSEFTLHLPLDDDGDPAIVTPSSEAASQVGGSTRVLVVDDNRAAASMLGIALETLGAKVRVVYDGVAAIGVAAEFRPHIVFMDIGMPGLDGHSAARCIRAQPGSSDALLIAVSGWGQAEMRQRSLDAGFDQHLVKPVDLPRLKLVLGNYAGTAA